MNVGEKGSRIATLEDELRRVTKYVNDMRKVQLDVNTMELNHSRCVSELKAALQQKEKEVMELTEKLQRKEGEKEESAKEESEKEVVKEESVKEESEKEEEKESEKEEKEEEKESEKEEEKESEEIVEEKEDEESEKEESEKEEEKTEETQPDESPTDPLTTSIEMVGVPLSLSQTAPLPSSLNHRYLCVIEELHREVLSLQQQNRDLKAELKAVQVAPLASARTAEWECDYSAIVESQKKSLEVLEAAVREKNRVIFEQNKLLRRWGSGEAIQSAATAQMTGPVQAMESVQATEGKGDEESVQQCAREQTLERQYEAEKSAMQQQFEAEKQSLLQQCETEKDAIKQQYETLESSLKQQFEEEKSSLQQRCEAEKKARRQEQLVVRANLQAIKAGSFSSAASPLDQTALATFAARQLASYNHTLTASSSSLLSAFASLSSQLHAYRQRVALLNDQLQSYVGNYRVMVRVRPVLPSDGDAPPAFSFADDYTLAIHSAAAQKEPRAFAFDRVFPPSAGQEAVFAEVQPAILSLFRGMNACVMAYGQTGAGKTFTMTGEAGREGVIPRCCALLFEELAFRREKPMRVKVSVAI